MTEFACQGYRIKPSVPKVHNLERVLTSWFTVLSDYAQCCDFDDCIYWYNERASLSSFAGALGRNGITFMEEYSCFKGGCDEQPDKSSLIRGRTDLCFCQNGMWYIVEAKQRWDSQRPLATEVLLKPAYDDTLKSLEGDKNCIPLALTFLAPGIPSSRKNDMDTFVNGYISDLKNDEYCDFWAYYAPYYMRDLQGTAAYSYPIIILLGKIPDEKSSALPA